MPKKLQLQKSIIKTALEDATFFRRSLWHNLQRIHYGRYITFTGIVKVFHCPSKQSSSSVLTVRQLSCTTTHQHTRHFELVRKFPAVKGAVMLNRPPYSPDLCPCGCFFLLKLKLHLNYTFHGIPGMQAIAIDYLTHIAKTDF